MQRKLVIIGGGVAGLSTAAAASGFDVTVLEAESQPGYHTSGRSAAVYIEAYENDIVWELSVTSRAYHEQLGARPIGCMTVADADHAGHARKFLDHWRTRCPTLAEIDPAELMRRVPILAPGTVEVVIEDPSALSLDAHALLESYRRKLAEHGGTLVTGCRVDRIERSGQTWKIGAGSRTWDADLLVNAAGAWGDEVARIAGVEPLGLLPRRRTALLVEPPLPCADWPLVHRAQGGLYFKPEAGQLMVSLGDETPSVPCDAQPEELDVAVAIERFEAMTTARILRRPHTWAGLRTFMPDRLPAAGFDGRVDGFFWLVGQGGFGMQTSPALAELAATLLRGERHPLAAALAPDRGPGAEPEAGGA